MINTKIIKVNNDMSILEEAGKVLRLGGLVAFPTETVYGLGADALSDDSVQKIYAAKGRPSDNPLIVHICDISDLEKLTLNITGSARKLVEAFWPGALTVILKKSSLVPDSLTAGLDSVAVRFPSNIISRTLIKYAKTPIAAPSANISGKPSPTKAEHVINDLFGRVDIIIDGGMCDTGVESTVVDCTGDVPILLRPGGISYEQLQMVLGNVLIDSGVLAKTVEGNSPRSPGMKYTHYSPDAPVVVVNGSPEKVGLYINSKISENQKNLNKKTGVLCSDELRSLIQCETVITYGKTGNNEEIAKKLFDCLRSLDGLGIDIIYVQGVTKSGIGLAVANRLYKAAGYNIVDIPMVL